MSCYNASHPGTYQGVNIEHVMDDDVHSELWYKLYCRPHMPVCVPVCERAASRL